METRHFCAATGIFRAKTGHLQSRRRGFRTGMGTAVAGIRGLSLELGRKQRKMPRFRVEAPSRWPGGKTAGWGWGRRWPGSRARRWKRGGTCWKCGGSARKCRRRGPGGIAARKRGHSGRGCREMPRRMSVANDRTAGWSGISATSSGLAGSGRAGGRYRRRNPRASGAPCPG